MGMGGQRHAPAALSLGKKPGSHCIGGWVGPRAGLDGCEKSRFDPRTAQPIPILYTEHYEKIKNLASHTKFAGIDYLLNTF
jgi:hypothetical protein